MPKASVRKASLGSAAECGVPDGVGTMEYAQSATQASVACNDRRSGRLLGGSVSLAHGRSWRLRMQLAWHWAEAMFLLYRCTGYGTLPPGPNVPEIVCFRV